LVPHLYQSAETEAAVFSNRLVITIPTAAELVAGWKQRWDCVSYFVTDHCLLAQTACRSLQTTTAYSHRLRVVVCNRPLPTRTDCVSYFITDHCLLAQTACRS
jgi:hypothetical protein